MELIANTMFKKSVRKRDLLHLIFSYLGDKKGSLIGKSVSVYKVDCGFF
jgi:hypothetical protein